MTDLKKKWLQYEIGDRLRQDLKQKTAHTQDTMLLDQDLLWADLPYHDQAADTFAVINRLKDMAVVWNACRLSEEIDLSLKPKIIYGLEWLSAHRYNEECLPYGNWWYWEIGVPIALSETLLLMEEGLDRDLTARLLLAIEKYVGDPRFLAQRFTNQALPSTGANLVWKVTAAALTAVIQGDEEKLSDARDALLPLFKNTSEGDGFYDDGSFIQHDRYAYTGGYGVSLLHDVVRLIVWVQGTRWEFPAEARESVAGWINRSFVPLMFRGSMLDMVSGRETSREDSQNHDSGCSVITSCLRFARVLQGKDRLRLLSKAKGWIIADTYKPYLAEAPPDTAKQALDLLEDSSILPANEEEFCKIFAHMDRAVMQGRGFAFSVSMFSERMYSYESINKENLKGWYTSYGMSLLYNQDLGQYADGYWPTVDPYRLPGTTVTDRRKEDGEGQGKSGGASFVGGVELDGKYAAVAMVLNEESDADSGKFGALKSWFLFGNKILAVGSGIQSQASVRAETIIENRQCARAEGLATRANGAEICRHVGEIEEIRPEWIHMQGREREADIGLFFPKPCSVHALREHRRGSWKDINDFGSAEKIEKTYRTLWFDHGEEAQDGRYAYVLLPGFDEKETVEFAARSKLNILESNEQVHAVEDSSLGLTAVHFWQTGKCEIGMFACESRLSLIMKKNSTSMTLAIADPTQKQTLPIKIELNMNITRVVGKSDRITIEPQKLGKTIIGFDPEGAGGQSFQMEFE